MSNMDIFINILCVAVGIISGMAVWKHLTEAKIERLEREIKELMYGKE